MDDIIRICKHYIETDSLDILQAYVLTLLNDNQDWPYLFQKVYLHACLKGKEPIAKWLQSAIFPMMDPIQQIAVRQTFSYGKYLLSKAPKAPKAPEA
jgi:hypothetical protein